MNNISKNISYIEATKSLTAIRFGIDNTPNKEQLCNMKILAEKIFQPLREFFGKPIGISSFFRSPAVNEILGGSTRSQHCLGQAIDIDADIINNGITNKELFDYIKSNLNFDQLIWEFGNNTNPQWIHVSYVSDSKNRNQILIAYKNSQGKTIYKNYE